MLKLCRLRPHLWFQLYWVIYLVWFFTLDWTITDPAYIIHSPPRRPDPLLRVVHLPLLQLVCAAGRGDGPAVVVRYPRLRQAVPDDVLGHDLLPHPLYAAAQRTQRSTAAEQVGRDNIAMDLMQLIWRADASNNVCPSIHCQSSGCMALAFAKSKLAAGRPWRKALAYGWAALICISTVFTKQHSVIDVVCGLALVAVWYLPLYGRRRLPPAPKCKISSSKFEQMAH